MKKYTLLAISALFTSLSFGQTLADAIKKTENERYAAASADFKTLIAKEPTKADNYFYYGDNFYKSDDIDSAALVWNKGISVDPANPLCIVGLGKSLWIKGDTTAARVELTKALTTTKNKNAEVLRKVAEIFIYSSNKRLDEAMKLLDIAIKIDPKNIENQLLYGDAILEKNPKNGTDAIKYYNQALTLDAKSAKALVRTAKLYQRSKNYELANTKYKEAQTLDPTYAPAFRENAELNLMFNKSKPAIENWKKYLELNNSIEARYRYTTSLFVGKNYCEAQAELLDLQAKNYNNFYVERMLFYSYAECPGTDVKIGCEKGLQAADRFFKTVPEAKIIGADYKYKGILFAKSGNDSLAIINYQIALQKDTSLQNDLYTEIAKSYLKAKRYNDAISYYERKAKGNSSVFSVQENYDLGRAYYFGPKNYVLADSCFTRLALKSPTYAPAYFWKARAEYKLETATNKWLAKDSYKKYLELLSEEDKKNPSNKSNMIEAAKYLGDYYFNSPEKNKEEAIKYWTIVKTLDPADKQAAAFFASPFAK